MGNIYKPLRLFIVILTTIIFGHTSAQVFVLDLKDHSTYTTTCYKILNASQWVVENQTCTLTAAPIYLNNNCALNFEIPVTIYYHGQGNLLPTEWAIAEYYCNGTWYHLDSIMGSTMQPVQSRSYDIPCFMGDFGIRVIFSTTDKTRRMYLNDGDIKVYEPCPVLLTFDFIDFNATKVDQMVKLEWSGVEYIEAGRVFIIERMIMNEEFEPIGELVPENVKRGITEFEFWDSRPVNANTYYRIKSIDIEGNEVFSDVVSIEKPHSRDKAIELLRVFPNPANDYFYLELYSVETADLSYHLTKPTGRVILENEFSITPGFNRIRIEGEAIGSGMYYLHIQSNHFNEVIPVVLN